MTTESKMSDKGSAVENARKADGSTALGGRWPLPKRATMLFWILNLASALFVRIRWIG